MNLIQNLIWCQPNVICVLPKDVASIEKTRIKAVKLETKSEFMMKELKKNIRLEQGLIALFGHRAKNH